jgi:hypothetical protein
MEVKPEGGLERFPFALARASIFPRRNVGSDPNFRVPQRIASLVFATIKKISLSSCLDVCVLGF